MFIVLNEKTGESYILKHQRAVIALLKCSVSTFQRKNIKDKYTYRGFTIIKPTHIILKGLPRGKSL
jgi:hypothetical protein